MDNWERFDETSLPDKEDFYSDLYMEDITDADYKHVKKVWKDFEIKNIDEYHYTYIMIHYYLQMYLKIFEINVLK